jgi:hypothetical protein
MNEAYSPSSAPARSAQEWLHEDPLGIHYRALL